MQALLQSLEVFNFAHWSAAGLTGLRVALIALAAWIVITVYLAFMQRLKNVDGPALPALLKMPRGFWGMQIAHTGLAVAVIGAAYRLLTAPLLQHFGDTAANTHGSARFATRQEAAPCCKTAMAS